MQVGPGVTGAGHTGAARIQGGVVVAEAGVAQVPAFAAHQGGAVTTESGGQDAVEQVDPVGHGNGHLSQGADAHQVARFV